MAYSHPYELQEPDDLEAMMKVDTPLHAEHQLDQVAGQFAQWRQTRTTTPRAHFRDPVGSR